MTPTGFWRTSLTRVSDDVLVVGGHGTSIPDRIVRTVVHLVVKAWPHVVAHPEVHAASSENEVSDLLCRLLAEMKKACGVENIRFQREVQTESGLVRGRIDIMTIYSFHEHEYFGIECKRVGAGIVSLADKYVDDGVMRFVSTKYSRGHDRGAMLAFVMTGCADDAAALLEPRVNSASTAVVRGWCADNRFTDYDGTYSSVHRTDGQIDVELVHLLLAGFRQQQSSPR